jgi:hypothetical protein
MMDQGKGFYDRSSCSVRPVGLCMQFVQRFRGCRGLWFWNCVADEDETWACV